MVSVSPDVAQDPDAPLVAAFLNGYFAAINAHNYKEYLALLSEPLQEAETARNFYAGYSSTTDSDAILSSISDTGPGSIGATVSFTSHQLPADSASDSACTAWNITLYLTQQSGRYLLGTPPSGYHAVYKPC